MTYHIAILGAGISGLATAWFLKQFMKSSVQLTIIEKNLQPGGWIETIQKDDFLFEQGPRSCRTKGMGYETLALVEALGLQSQIVVSHSDAQNRYLYDGKGLRRFPKHLWEIPVNCLTRKGWLSALWQDLFASKRKEKDESIRDFFFRRLGVSWTKSLVEPFVSGIYAGDCNRLSLKSCFPLFDQWEQQYRSLLLGALWHRPSFSYSSDFIKKVCCHPMFSFQKGMATLTQVLSNELKDCLCLGHAVNHLNIDAQNVNIQLDNGRHLVVNHVISTLPTFALSSLLTHYPDLAEKLKKLPYSTVMIVNIGYRQFILPFKGFGYLVPPHLRSSVLGCVWDSCIFPEHNQKDQTRLAVMMGGVCYPEVEQMSKLELIEQALQSLRKHLRIRIEPEVVQVKRAQNAIPQFEINYLLWKKDVQDAVSYFFPHLTISGSGWTGVSLNDCIAQARYLAKKLQIFLENSNS